MSRSEQPRHEHRIIDADGHIELTHSQELPLGGPWPGGVQRRAVFTDSRDGEHLVLTFSTRHSLYGSSDMESSAVDSMQLNSHQLEKLIRRLQQIRQSQQDYCREREAWLARQGEQ